MLSNKIASSMMVAGTMIVSMGCLDQNEPASRQIDDVQVDPLPDVDAQYRPVRGAVDGRLAGEVGPVSGLDQSANLLSAYDDGYYLSVETVVELDSRAVMTLLSVSNGADVFRPGLNATFTLENAGEDDVQVTMLGCVGQDVGVYDEYDSPADEVTVGVTAPEVPGETDEMNVVAQARWFDRNVETGERLESFRSAQTRFTLIR